MRVRAAAARDARVCPLSSAGTATRRGDASYRAPRKAFEPRACGLLRRRQRRADRASTRLASMESVLKHRFLDPACGLDRDALVRGEASSSLVSALLARVGGKRSSAVLGGAEAAALSGVMGALVPGALGERIWRGFSAALI